MSNELIIASCGLIGFVNTDFAFSLNVLLSIIIQPAEDAVYLALYMLVELIKIDGEGNKRLNPYTVLLKTSL